MRNMRKNLQKPSRTEGSPEKPQIGIAYNLWDNIELLPFSIRPIRQLVGYICVIYQNKSNWGVMLDQEPELELYKRLGLIDDYFLYEPDMKLTPKENETIKRNIGLDKCREAGCDIHSTMDCDEIYNPQEYQRAINMFRGDSSVCSIVTYYGDSKHVLTPYEAYYVPLFYRIDDRKFKSINCGIDADPSRTMEMNGLMIFDRSIIQMHHLSYVRKDIRQKLENMSASVNWRDKIDDLVEYHKNWKGGKAWVASGLYDTKKVKSII